MPLSVRQKLYLLFGFQLISFIGLFSFFYLYLIPAVRKLEIEKYSTAQIIKNMSELQLITNHYFEGMVSLGVLKNEIKKIYQTLPEQEIKKTA